MKCFTNFLTLPINSRIYNFHMLKTLESIRTLLRVKYSHFSWKKEKFMFEQECNELSKMNNCVNTNFMSENSNVKHNYEFKLQSRNNLELEKIRSVMTSAFNKENYTIDSTFWQALYSYCKELEYLSINNFKVVYQRDEGVFNAIIEFLKLGHTKQMANKINNLNNFNHFNNLNCLNEEVCLKAIMKLLYVVHFKKQFNLSRQESDEILPKLFKIFEKQFNTFSISSTLEIITIFAYFGINFNLSNLEIKIKRSVVSDKNKTMASDEVTYETFDRCIRTVLQFKNNKMMSYKSKLISIVIKPFIELSSKCDFGDKCNSLFILSTVLNEFPLSENVEHINKFIQNFLDFLPNADLSTISQKNFTNIIKSLPTLEKDFDLTPVLNCLYDKLNEFLDPNQKKENKFNLPLFFILIKNISQLTNEAYIPKSKELLNSIYNFALKEIGFYKDKRIIIRESLYLLSLMRKSKYEFEEVTNCVFEYMKNDIYFINTNEKSLQDYLHYLNTNFESDYLLELVDKFEQISSSSETSVLLAFDMFVRACYFTKGKDSYKEKLDNIFNNFVTNLDKLNSFDLPKMCLNLLTQYVNYYQMQIQEDYRKKIIEKLVCHIISSFYEIDTFPKTKAKLFLLLNEIETSDTNINVLLNIIKKEIKDCHYFIPEIKLIAENKSVSISNKSFKALIGLLDKEHTSGKRPHYLNSFNAEFIVVFVYHVLKNNLEMEREINAELVNKLLDKTLKWEGKFIRINFPLANTERIINLFRQENITCGSLEKCYEEQRKTKLLVNKKTISTNKL